MRGSTGWRDVLRHWTIAPHWLNEAIGLRSYISTHSRFSSRSTAFDEPPVIFNWKKYGMHNVGTPLRELMVVSRR